MAGVENRLDRVAHLLRRGERTERVLEQHRGREDRGERIRDVPAGDVGRRAVNRLVEADPARAETGRRQHPHRSGDLRRLVREDVAEEILGDDHVEARRIAHQQHRARIDELVGERHVGEFAGDLVDHRHPELRRLEHVRLVHVRHVLASPLRRLERDARDARDLVFVVHHRVVGRATAVRRCPVPRGSPK